MADPVSRSKITVTSADGIVKPGVGVVATGLGTTVGTVVTGGEGTGGVAEGVDVAVGVAGVTDAVGFGDCKVAVGD